MHPGGRGSRSRAGLSEPPALPPCPSRPASPPPLAVSWAARAWLTSDGLGGGGAGRSVGHAAGELLLGPLARDCHLAAGGVEAGVQVLDGREGQRALVQGCCVPGHGHWAREVARDQAAQRHRGGIGSTFATGTQGVDGWAVDGGCGDRTAVNAGLRTVTCMCQANCWLWRVGCGVEVGRSSAGNTGTVFQLWGTDGSSWVLSSSPDSTRDALQ